MNQYNFPNNDKLFNSTSLHLNRSDSSTAHNSQLMCIAGMLSAPSAALFYSMQHCACPGLPALCFATLVNIPCSYMLIILMVLVLLPGLSLSRQTAYQLLSGQCLTENDRSEDKTHWREGVRK